MAAVSNTSRRRWRKDAWLRCCERKSGAAPVLVEEEGRNSGAAVARYGDGEQVRSSVMVSCRGVAMAMQRVGDGAAALVVEVPWKRRGGSRGRLARVVLARAAGVEQGDGGVVDLASGALGRLKP